MNYSNPKIPEGINTSEENPLKEFFILSFGVFGIFIIIMVLLAFLANYLAHYIPFEAETALADKFANDLFKQEESEKTNPTNPTQIYLQQLADKIALAEDLPQGMKITLHYIDDDTINAFATLGGHVFMFKGLLEKLPNENAVAMVLAHEIAHIKYRHPIQGMSRGVIIGLALTMLNGSLGNGLAEQAFDSAGGLTGLKFNREQEADSDTEALKALQQIYGHVFGAVTLFEVLKAETKEMNIPAFFSTHPLSEQRIQAIKQFQQQHSNNTTASLTDLPDNFLQ